jgi:hypothetical protein
VGGVHGSACGRPGRRSSGTREAATNTSRSRPGAAASRPSSSGRAQPARRRRARRTCGRRPVSLRRGPRRQRRRGVGLPRRWRRPGRGSRGARAEAVALTQSSAVASLNGGLHPSALSHPLSAGSDRPGEAEGGSQHAPARITAAARTAVAKLDVAAVVASGASANAPPRRGEIPNRPAGQRPLALAPSGRAARGGSDAGARPGGGLYRNTRAAIGEARAREGLRHARHRVPRGSAAAQR